MKQRTGTVLTACVVSAAIVAACGGGGAKATVDTYCNSLKTTKQWVQKGDQANPDYKRLAADINKLVSKSPAEIRADVKLEAQALAQIAKNPQQVDKYVSDPKFSSADNHLQQYTEQKCGFKLNS